MKNSNFMLKNKNNLISIRLFLFFLRDNISSIAKTILEIILMEVF